MNKNLQSDLFFLPANKQGLVAKLRNTLLSTALELTETIRRGRLTYVTKTKPIAFICIKRATSYIELGFFKGVYLDDPKKLLNGKSREIRRVKIKSFNEIPVLQIKRWVKAAILITD